jgi:hypothetical protein
MAIYIIHRPSLTVELGRNKKAVWLSVRDADEGALGNSGADIALTPAEARELAANLTIAAMKGEMEK